MNFLPQAFQQYAADVASLAAGETTSEPSYYPAIRSLLVSVLRELGLPDDVRVNTAERRTGGGRDQPDFALYDQGGDFALVLGEVKGLAADLSEMALSTDRNDQIGRYLSQTRVVLLCNVRGFGLLTVDRRFTGEGPVPPDQRRLVGEVDFWPSGSAVKSGRAPGPQAMGELAELLETALTPSNDRVSGSPGVVQPFLFEGKGDYHDPLNPQGIHGHS